MMSENKSSSEWLPLMEYAIKKGVSLSTLRRHIKANKVKYKIENGRYLLFDGDFFPKNSPPIQNRESLGLQSKLQKLERDLQKAQEEIAELKMLIALYEERMSPHRFDS